MRAVRLTVVVAILTGCTVTAVDTDDTEDSGDSGSEQVFLPPDAQGAWNVGTRKEMADGPDDLTLTVQLWFPTDATDGAIADYDGFSPGNSFDDPAPSCATPHPVVVFSHGNTGFRYQSGFLMERLASHGFVVVAPDHVGNTAFDDTLERTEVAVRRPLDVRASFDHLVSVSPLAACVDADAGYAVIGHSFGGWTTLATAGAQIDLEGLAEACDGGKRSLLCGLDEDPDLSDDRVWGAVPMAPLGAFSLGAGLAEVEVPILVVGGLQDQLLPWEVQQVPIFEGLTGSVDAHLLGLDKVGHFSFGSPCLSAPDGCGPDFLPPEESQARISASVTAFLMEILGAEPWLPPTWEGTVWR